MQYFLLFIRRNSFFFFFLLLEIIAFILIANSRSYQSYRIVKAANQLSGNLHSTTTGITDYFYLKRANEYLNEENAALRSALKSSFQYADTNFLYKDTVFRFIGAKVIHNSVNRRNNYIMLNKGSKHGIREDMGVISSNGLVGTVIKVSKNYSTVMSLLHKNASVSARIKKNGQLVNVIWNGSNYRLGTVTDIPTHIELMYGDTIITSGNSFVFPENIKLGTIHSFNSEGMESLNQATMKFGVDFNNLYHVFIIENLKRNEQLELLEESQLDE